MDLPAFLSRRPRPPAPVPDRAPGPVYRPPAWPSAAPLQRTVAAPDLVTAPARFRTELVSWADPSLTGAPAHVVSPEAPSGLGHGLTRPAAPVESTAPEPAPPVVQRQPGPDVADASDRSWRRLWSRVVPVAVQRAVQGEPATPSVVTGRRAGAPPGHAPSVGAPASTDEPAAAPAPEVLRPVLPGAPLPVVPLPVVPLPVVPLPVSRSFVRADHAPLPAPFTLPALPLQRAQLAPPAQPHPDAVREVWAPDLDAPTHSRAAAARDDAAVPHVPPTAPPSTVPSPPGASTGSTGPTVQRVAAASPPPARALDAGAPAVSPPSVGRAAPSLRPRGVADPSVAATVHRDPDPAGLAAAADRAAEPSSTVQPTPEGTGPAGDVGVPVTTPTLGGTTAAPAAAAAGASGGDGDVVQRSAAQRPTGAGPAQEIGSPGWPGGGVVQRLVGAGGADAPPVGHVAPTVGETGVAVQVGGPGAARAEAGPTAAVQRSGTGAAPAQAPAAVTGRPRRFGLGAPLQRATNAVASSLPSSLPSPPLSAGPSAPVERLEGATTPADARSVPTLQQTAAVDDIGPAVRSDVAPAPVLVADLLAPTVGADPLTPTASGEALVPTPTGDPSPHAAGFIPGATGPSAVVQRTGASGSAAYEPAASGSAGFASAGFGSAGFASAVSGSAGSGPTAGPIPFGPTSAPAGSRGADTPAPPTAVRAVAVQALPVRRATTADTGDGADTGWSPAFPDAAAPALAGLVGARPPIVGPTVAGPAGSPSGTAVQRQVVAPPPSTRADVPRTPVPTTFTAPGGAVPDPAAPTSTVPASVQRLLVAQAVHRAAERAAPQTVPPPVPPVTHPTGPTSEVQRAEDDAPAAAPPAVDAVPVDPATPAPAGATAVAAAGATAGAAAGATGGLTDVDALVGKLYDPLVQRLRAELRLDRERAGHVLDLRP